MGSGTMSGNIKLAPAGTVEEGWRVIPMMEAMSKPEVQAEVTALMTNPAEQGQALASGSLIILTRGEAPPQKYRLIPATDPVPEGWGKLPTAILGDQAIMSQVMMLLTSSDMVDGFNQGRLIAIEKGRETVAEPEYSFVRRDSADKEYDIPPGWKLLPILETQQPGVPVSLGRIFAQNENYCNEYNTGLLALTVKE